MLSTSQTLRITVKFAGYDNASTLDFTVNAADSCATTTLTIDSSILNSLNYNYEIRSGPHNVPLTTNLITASPTPYTNCPTVVFSFKDRITNGSINGAIFSYDPSTLIFSIVSSDTNDADTYQMKLIVNYDGYTKTATRDFDVVLFDACTTSTITVNSGILQSQTVTYQIGAPMYE